MSTSPVPLEKLYQLFLQHPFVTTNSIDVTPGGIFFGLRGTNHDGNLYASDALKNGAAYAIIDRPEARTDDRCVLVNDTLTALQYLAKTYRKTLRAKVIGITGSNGKTTTKELMGAVLAKKHNTVATKGNLNNHIGVPLTLLSTPPDTEVLVVEMGANHIGEIELLCQIAMPHAGLITNIGKAHLEGFGSLDGVIKAKSELYAYLGSQSGTTILCHLDDPLLMKLAKEAGSNLLTYGTTTNADVLGTPLHDTINLCMKWNNKHRIETKLIGSYNFQNAMAAIATGVFMGVHEEAIVTALEEFTPTNHRSQLLHHTNNTIFVDCYNANPASMREAIQHFLRFTTGKKCFILGDMLELGDYADEEHKSVGELVSQTDALRIFVGKQFLQSCGETGDHLFADVDQLNQWLSTRNLSGYHILLKGSRGIRLEKALPLL